MEKLELTKNEVLNLHETGNEQTKKWIVEKFSKELFQDEWMRLWEKFCNQNNLNLTLPYPNPKNPDEEYIDAQFMMMHIIRKKRKKKPDFNNSNEYKYSPYFDMRSSSGFGFAGATYDDWGTLTYFGSRLCFPDDEKLMKEVAKEYLPIYEKIMIEP